MNWINPESVSSIIIAAVGGGVTVPAVSALLGLRKEKIDRETATVASMGTANEALDRTVERLARQVAHLSSRVEALETDQRGDRTYITRAHPLIVEYVPLDQQVDPPPWYIP